MADRTVTIAPTGGDYTSLASALAGESDFQAGEDNIVFRITGSWSSADTSQVIVSSKFTTSASHKVIIESDSSNRAGTAWSNSKYRLDYNNWGAAFSSSINHVLIKGIQITNTYSGINGECAKTDGSYVIFDSCFLFGGAGGINFGSTSYSGAVNCICIHSGINMVNAEGTCFAYNVTVLNSGIGIRAGQYNAQHITNCYAGGNDTDYSVGASTILTNCRSSDGSGSTTQISLVNCYFTSTAAGSEDVSFGSSSQLINIGTNLSSDSVYPFSTDITGTTRSGTWDIGAYEYVAVSSGHPAASRFRGMHRNNSVRYA